MTFLFSYRKEEGRGPILWKASQLRHICTHKTLELTWQGIHLKAYCLSKEIILFTLPLKNSKCRMSVMNSDKRIRALKKVCLYAHCVWCYFLHDEIAYVYICTVYIIVVFMNANNLHIILNTFVLSLFTYFYKMLHNSFCQFVSNLK